MPPFGGFWSKLIIVIACIQAGRPFLAFVAAGVGILTLAYYFKALSPVLFGRAPASAAIEPPRKIYWSMGLAMIILAVLSSVSVYMLMPVAGNTLNVLLRQAAAILANGDAYAAVIMGVLK